MYIKCQIVTLQDRDTVGASDTVPGILAQCRKADVLLESAPIELSLASRAQCLRREAVESEDQFGDDQEY